MTAAIVSSAEYAKETSSPRSSAASSMRPASPNIFVTGESPFPHGAPESSDRWSHNASAEKKTALAQLTVEEFCRGRQEGRRGPQGDPVPMFLTRWARGMWWKRYQSAGAAGVNVSKSLAEWKKRLS